MTRGFMAGGRSLKQRCYPGTKLNGERTALPKSASLAGIDHTWGLSDVSRLD
ncbi:MAG TPA: hypothetical protein VKR27_05055 [Acidimicrobiales bacterium]|nr:hypothetical protein [Acidimicrobiales bacterium]